LPEEALRADKEHKDETQEHEDVLKIGADEASD
jgi:hypothetical protein